MRTTFRNCAPCSMSAVLGGSHTSYWTWNACRCWTAQGLEIVLLDAQGAIPAPGGHAETCGPEFVVPGDPYRDRCRQALRDLSRSGVRRGEFRPVTITTLHPTSKPSQPIPGGPVQGCRGQLARAEETLADKPPVAPATLAGKPPVASPGLRLPLGEQLLGDQLITSDELHSAWKSRASSNSVWAKPWWTWGSWRKTRFSPTSSGNCASRP